METIKKGKDNPHVITCPHCGSVISYYPEEASLRFIGISMTIVGIQRETERFITCPECSMEIVLQREGTLTVNNRN